MKIKTHTCQECDKSFFQGAGLTRHKRVVHFKIKDHICDNCGYACYSAYTLKKHIENVHLKIKSFPCSETGCSFAATTAVYLKQHIQTHTEIKDNKCEKCPKSFAMKSCLKRHMRLLHDEVQEEKEKCSLCDFVSTRNGITSHFRRIHMPKRFPCSDCSYVSQTNKNLERHVMMIHRNEKEFQCMECNKTFNTRGELVTHVKGVHFNIKKRVSCNICDKEVSNIGILNSHMRSKHGLEDEIPKQHPCPICDKVFGRNQTLKNHIKTMHGEDEEARRIYRVTRVLCD